MDVMAVHAAVSEAARLAREERQPSMIEAIAYRYRGHSMSDPDTTREGSEKERWQARDPLVTFERVLLGEGVVTREEADAVRAAAEQTVEEAAAFAEESAEVRPRRSSPATSTRDPWSDDRAAAGRSPPRGRGLVSTAKARPPGRPRPPGPSRSPTARR